MTIATDIKIKKGLVLNLLTDQTIEDSLFPKNQIVEVISGGNRIGLVRLITDKQQTYEVSLDLDSIRNDFELAPMLSDSELADWSCKVKKTYICGMNQTDYTLRHKKKNIGEATTIDTRLINQDIGNSDWDKLVMKMYEACSKLDRCRVRPFGITKAEAQGILFEYCGSPLKDYMTIEAIAEVEMAKRNAVYCPTK